MKIKCAAVPLATEKLTEKLRNKYRAGEVQATDYLNYRGKEKPGDVGLISLKVSKSLVANFGKLNDPGRSPREL